MRRALLHTLRKTGLACFLLVLGGLVVSCGGAVDGPTGDDDSSIVDGLGTDGTAADTSTGDVVPDQAAETEAGDSDADASDIVDATESEIESPDVGLPDEGSTDVEISDATAPDGISDTETETGGSDVVSSDEADTDDPDGTAADVDPSDTADVEPSDTTDTDESPDGAYEVTVQFSEVGLAEGEFVTLFTEVIALPPSFETVEAQIAIRGDLDSFPMAFMALLVDQEGGIQQCGDLAGLPQKPNNILDDVYRVAFPRPENLHPGSVYYPPAPPYDYQPIPCQEAFQGKTEIIIGIAVSGIYPVGMVGNQGPNACGGLGCPNDAIVKLRFLPNPAEPESCEDAEIGECVCPDGIFGAQACADGVWGDCDCIEEPVDPPCIPGSVQACVCNDGSQGEQFCNLGSWEACQCADLTVGSCETPQAFEIGPDHPQVVLSNPGTALHAVPWPPFGLACPTSKPPFSVEYYYEMTVTVPGLISVTYEADPEPWDINQFWIDMLQSCTMPYQCNASYAPLEGAAAAGIYIVGLTLAPPQEIFIGDQDWWNFAITVTWAEETPP